MAQWLAQWTLLGIIALCSYSHSASPRLDVSMGTGYGTGGQQR